MMQSIDGRWLRQRATWDRLAAATTGNRRWEPAPGSVLGVVAGVGAEEVADTIASGNHGSGVQPSR